MRLHRVALTAALALLPLTLSAQTPAKHDPVGSVTGQVVCADTQRPARLAQVKLVAVPDKSALKSPAPHDSFSDAAPAGNSVQTSLDGTYTIRNVKPGAYYLVVDQDGYLVPLSQFSLKDLANPDSATKARIASSIHAITVEANQTTKEDVVLQRGASISGTVTYDDGSPASGLGIELLVKGSDGKWTPMNNSRYREFHGFANTDDNGFYRITGLPPGEYATQANLSIADQERTTGPMPNDPSITVAFDILKVRFSLPLYSGDVFRKTEAKPYKLGSGEARAGTDLVFPLAKLHKVGGQVLAQDGHAVNGGTVKLLYPDDKSEMTNADIQYEDQAFHLDFIPEGDFLLKITGPKDVTKVQVENPQGYSPRFHEETKTLKTYGDAEQPLLVKGDTQDIIATVPDLPKSTSKPAAPTQ